MQRCVDEWREMVAEMLNLCGGEDHSQRRDGKRREKSGGVRHKKKWKCPLWSTA